LKRKELVTQVDERRSLALAAKFEVKQATKERQSRFDISDFQGEVIEPDSTGFSRFRHEALHTP
jgi:hypothetical protein